MAQIACRQGSQKLRNPRHWGPQGLPVIYKFLEQLFCKNFGSYENMYTSYIHKLPWRQNVTKNFTTILLYFVVKSKFSGIFILKFYQTTKSWLLILEKLVFDDQKLETEIQNSKKNMLYEYIQRGKIMVPIDFNP